MSKTWEQPFEPPLSAGSGQRTDVDVLMLYQGDEPHGAHQAFGDAVDATYQHFETGAELGEGSNKGSITARVQQGARLSHRDVVIAEGSSPLMTLAAYKAWNPNSTALYLAADEFFYTLPQRQSRHLWRGLGPVIGRALDGCIAVGSDAYDWARRYLGDIPCEIVRPPISDGKYKHLEELEPTSPGEPFNVLTAGNAQPSKRIRRVLDAVEQLGDRLDTRVKLTILGQGHLEEDYASHPLTEVPGFVPIDEFPFYFNRASVYVQASEGDSFPVASLEGMLSATPTVVTEAVGTQEFLPDQFVSSPDARSLTSALEELARLDETERQDHGEHLRPKVAGLTEQTQQKRFAEAVRGFL